MFRLYSYRTFLRPRALTAMAMLWLALAAALAPSGPAAGQPTAGPRFLLNVATNPLAGKTIRVLCYASTASTQPFDDVLVRTDAEGRPLDSLPTGCNYVAALYSRYTQPSGKPEHGAAYDVYATSWPPGSRKLLPSIGDIYLQTKWPLVLFHVVASLEWQPSAVSTFPADLRVGLKQASAYLYDMTEGQMAFGPVEIQTGGQRWNAADLRFLAANDYRPSAYVGGIVPTSRPYTTKAGGRLVFAPGEVFLGRFWDGRDAFDPGNGRWSLPNAYRTLVHEWGHYALFLFDEYQTHIDTDGDGRSDGKAETWCTRADLPMVADGSLAASAMSYQYTASEFWRYEEPAGCVGTDQWQVHQESDWATLGRWSRIQGLPAALRPLLLKMPKVLKAGPNLGFAGDLFGREPRLLGALVSLPAVGDADEDAMAGAAAEDRTVSVMIDPPLRTARLQSLYPQVYLVRDAVTTGVPSPARVLYQGSTFGLRAAPANLGTITLLGVEDPAHARVYIDHYARLGGSRYVYPAPGANPDPPLANQLQAVPDTWRASLNVRYGMVGSSLTTMVVALNSAYAPVSKPVAQLCTPAATVGCPNDPAWRKTMVATGPTSWTATFTSAPGTELPHYGVLRVQGPGVGEVVRWFQAAGGAGGAHIDAETPLRDGPVMVDAVQSLSGQSNRVVIMPAANYQAVTRSLPAGIGGIVGYPLDLDILLPDGTAPALADRSVLSSSAEAAAPTAALPSPVLLTFFYSQEAASRLGVTGSQLRLLRFTNGGWAELPVSGRSPGTSWPSQAVRLNWLASGPVTTDGIFAIAYPAAP